jgi:hypothetical protein
MVARWRWIALMGDGRWKMEDGRERIERIRGYNNTIKERSTSRVDKGKRKRKRDQDQDQDEGSHTTQWQ